MTTGEIRRVLVAVDDTAASMRAVDLALWLASVSGAEVRFVHVTADGRIRRALAPGPGRGELEERLERAAAALLDHVTTRARRLGVTCTAVSLLGEPETEVIAQTHGWGADLVVLGRSESGVLGQPYVGHIARHVLEFSEVPVLVVPRPGP